MCWRHIPARYCGRLGRLSCFGIDGVQNAPPSSNRASEDARGRVPAQSAPRHSDFVQILFRFPPLKMRVPEVSSVPQTRGRTLLKTPSAPVQPKVRVSGHLLSVREEATATMTGLRWVAWKCLRHRDARAKIQAFLLWERHGALSQAHA